MSSMNFETARSQMLGQQVRAWEVFDDRVLDVMGAMPRELYVPERFRELAFADTEIPLDHGQSMMAPKIEGRMLQALEIEPLDRILEVGTGSGYVTACLSRLGAHVHSIDIHGDFVAAAADVLREQKIGNVDVETADGLALPGRPEYDVVVVTGSVPAWTRTEAFIAMLKPRGRLFIVVGREPAMEAVLFRMGPDGRSAAEPLFETVLTPLVNSDAPPPFEL